MTDRALLPAGGSVTVDPLANDEDPNNLVLVLQDVTVPDGSGLHVWEDQGVQTRPVFEGRPGLDRVFRIVIAGAATSSRSAAIATQDLRSGAVAVLMVAFLLRETFVLDERQRQAALVVMVAAALVWAVQLFS